MTPVDLLANRKTALDWRTAVVIVVMCVGLVAVIAFHAQGGLPTWAAVVLGTLLMNLSFTAWHEPSHGNFSTSSSVNAFTGIVTSFASVYPGYYARRREHLVHHKYEGQDGKDPVYPRIQTSFWGFPWQLVKVTIERKSLDVPDSFLPYTPAQRLADWISNLAALGVVVAAFQLGFGMSVIWGWIVPRAIVFWMHAYYICFFPHAIPEGGYQLYRIRQGGWLLRLLTVDQSLHGIHHRWPFIPWHRYNAVVKGAMQEVESAGVEFM